VVEQLCWKEELHHVCVSYGSERCLGKLHKDAHLESCSPPFCPFYIEKPSRLEFVFSYLMFTRVAAYC